MYERAAELQNETMAPTIDSYGEKGVYLRYKQNKWFESVNIIQLKQLKAQEEGEALRQIFLQINR